MISHLEKESLEGEGEESEGDSVSPLDTQTIISQVEREHVLSARKEENDVITRERSYQNERGS